MPMLEALITNFKPAAAMPRKNTDELNSYAADALQLKFIRQKQQWTYTSKNPLSEETE